MHTISRQPLTFSDLQQIVRPGGRLTLSPHAVEDIQRCRAYLDEKIAAATDPIYGINTGFGSLYNLSLIHI